MAALQSNDGVTQHVRVTHDKRTDLYSVVLTTTCSWSRTPEIHRRIADLHLSREALDILIKELQTV